MLVIRRDCLTLILSYFVSLCYVSRYSLLRVLVDLDLKTANTIATSIVHSKLDYCKSFPP